MSGNPFRRSAPPSALHSASAAGHDGSRVQSDDRPAQPPHAPARTKKHVRLASPPASPPEPSSPEVDDSLARRLGAARHAAALPPPQDVSDDSADDLANDPSEDSPINPDDDQGDDAPLKPAASGYPGRMEAASQKPGIPNPFERTLANIEPAAQQNVFQSEHASSSAQAAAEQSAGHKAKGSLDVDSFKRLLMTGSAAPASAGASATAGVQPRAHITIGGDTSSGTDASSASRNSLFESVLQVHEDSPRSSYERTSFDGGNDDDQSTLIGGDRRPQKKKPPPPKHRHGKSITRAPQVVSFSDFSPSFESPGTRSTGPQRTPSDVHKPLPPRPRGSSGPKNNKDLPSSPPAEPVPPKDAAEPAPSSDPPAAAENSPPVKTPEPAPQRRKPPTPPLARRHSQLKSSDSRSRSNSGATFSSQPEASSSSSDQQTPTTSPPPPPTPNKPPPPPPTRRSGASSMVQSSVDLSASRSSSRRSTASSMHNPMPLRSSHRLSGSALDITSPTSTGPPPPPPPRRGSSKSSFEMQRPSASALAQAGESSRRSSMEGAKGRSRTASGASERVLSSPAAEAGPNGMRSGSGGGEGVDLLSELDKLQQEVEALRQKSVTKA
ncbi:hypothetical protein GTA08_BOTSDO11069 [Neofusicoccum parvum]|uniref:Uncharacterized protein n=1 Tax=Neofusicoccum parvum TaxID=310453 RepID=A0ACB5RNG7_9PEZI|nr:hypothetical protein GTA08_BOTSDO11069 [Neofusicoccum parvum]